MPLFRYYSSSWSFAKSALRVTWVGPASGRHLGSEKRPKSARNRFVGGFSRNPDFRENRYLFVLTRRSYPSAMLRLQRSQRAAAWHKPISDIHRLVVTPAQGKRIVKYHRKSPKTSQTIPFVLIRLTSIRPCSGITIRAGFSQNLLYESLVLGRLREGTWVQKSGPKVHEIEFWEDFREIRIFVKIGIFHAHSAELSFSPAPATEKPESCRLAQTYL